MVIQGSIAALFFWGTAMPILSSWPKCNCSPAASRDILQAMSSEILDKKKFFPAGLTPDIYLAILLFAATFVAYWPSLHGGMLWDDEAHITRPALQSVGGLGRIWFELGATQQYYPVLHTAFWV